MKVLGIWNLVVFLLYGADKRQARKGGQRISERTLLLTALLMGAPGAWMGMYFFRHKTRKEKFRLVVPACLVANGIVLYLVYRSGYNLF